MLVVYPHNWGDHTTLYINATEGFCKVNLYDEGSRVVGELYDLIVYPEFRGMGHGRRLLELAISASKKQGCDFLVLWPNCESWVEEWYKRKGFRIDYGFHNYDKEPGWSLNLNQL